MTIVQFIVPLEEWEATIAFYDNWTDDQAGDYVRTESESGGVGWQNVPAPGSDKQVIAVSLPARGRRVRHRHVHRGAGRIASVAESYGKRRPH